MRWERREPDLSPLRTTAALHWQQQPIDDQMVSVGHSSRGSSPSWPGQESCEEAEASLPPPPTSANLIFHFCRARQTAHQVRGLEINTTTDHTTLTKERILPKTILEILFVTFAVSETRTGRLSSANTAALYTPIHLRFVKAKHLFLPAVACENKQELVLLITVRYRKKNLGNSLGKPKVNYNSGRITARSGRSFILHWLRRAGAPRMHFLIRRKKKKIIINNSWNVLTSTQQDSWQAHLLHSPTLRAHVPQHNPEVRTRLTWLTKALPTYVAKQAAGQAAWTCPSPWISRWQLNPGSLELPRHHHRRLLEASLPNSAESE